MHYKVLFRVEKYDLLEKLKKKIKNLNKYMEDDGHTLDIEVVFSGDVVKHFQGDRNDFLGEDLDIALCANALKAESMEPINNDNIRTVSAGIGEIIEKKSQGWIEFTVE
ncbi:MAG: hypothetical protein GXY87_04925 [Tissierellia bacterium]|nr:hypothetical protein [Tissierellia bacterium]